MTLARHGGDPRRRMPTACVRRRRPAARAVRAGRAPILRPSQIITAESIENALRVLLALGGSTNAIIHLAAIAGRARPRAVSLERLNALSDETPVLVDLKPVGQHYMEDFFAAGGVGAVLRELQPLLHLDCMTVDRRDAAASASPTSRSWVDRKVIRPLADPDRAAGRPRRPVRHPRAGRRHPQALRRRRRRCSSAKAARWCSTSLEDLAARIDDPATSTSRRTTSWCCRTPGRRAATPCRRPATCRSREARARRRQGHGAHLRRAHERHRLRHHRAARRAGGGGRRPARRSCATATASRSRSPTSASISWSTRPRLAKRKAAHRPATAEGLRGYARLYSETVMQAEAGCDFDFLRKG